MKRDLFTPKVGQKAWNCAPDPTCFHVRGIVDDQVVLRHWSPRKGWMYRCEPMFVFDHLGAYRRKRKEPTE